MKRSLVHIVLLMDAALVAVPAMAQQAPDAPTPASGGENGIGDIVVTAQKRSESVQSVPLAITALSGQSLADRNIADVGSLGATVPNMNVGNYGGSAHIAIRGVGFDNVSQGHEGRVAYHLDGVYVARPSAILGTFYDVDRVEVLRGPQGTLYGRNATAGTINVITKAPTDHWEGYLRVGYGNYNALTSEGALGGPIAPGVRIRVAYTVEDHDGYGRNIFTGNEIDNARRRGVRGTLSFDLGGSGKLDLAADYYRERDADYGNHYLGVGVDGVIPSGIALGGVVAPNVRDIASDFDPINDRESYGLAARAEFDLGGATLKSITAYRHSNFLTKTEFDASTAALTFVHYFDRSRQFSQELQLSGATGRLKYILGGYYFDERAFGGTHIPLSLALFGLPSTLVTQGYRVEGHIHTRALAAFGQLDYDIADQFTLTLGGRYSWEKHTIDDEFQFDLTRPWPPTMPFIDIYNRKGADTTDSSFTPKFQLSYNPSKDFLLYASLSKGFKSGGFDIGGSAPPFKPETLWAYEAGVKSTFADGKVRINAAAFYYDYTDLQVSKVIFNQIILVNAASSKIYGAEAELTLVPASGFQIDASPAWLHTEYKNFSTSNPNDPSNPNPVDLSGRQLVEAPKFSVHAGAQYSWAMASGDVKLRGELAYTDRVYFDAFNTQRISRAPNTKFNVFLTYTGSHWDASAYVLNLTDKTTIASALIASSVAQYPILGTLEPPRTYGVKVGYHF